MQQSYTSHPLYVNRLIESIFNLATTVFGDYRSNWVKWEMEY